MGISANGYSAASYHTVNQDTERNPEDEGKHHDWAHYVISQELPWCGDEVEDSDKHTKEEKKNNNFEFD